MNREAVGGIFHGITAMDLDEAMVGEFCQALCPALEQRTNVFNAPRRDARPQLARLGEGPCLHLAPQRRR